MSHDMTDAELADAMKAMHAPPPVPPKKKLRPKGWNAAVAAKRAALRIAKLEAREDQRGRRTARVGSVAGFPASINRRTGEPHEHRRQTRRHLRQQAKLVLAGRRPWPWADQPAGHTHSPDPPQA